MGIIAILAAMINTSLIKARMKARDANRKATLKEIQKALELYYSDHGKYPSGRGYSAWDARPDSVTPGDWGRVPYWCFSGNQGCDDGYSGNGPIKALVDGGYMKPPPEDPLNTQGFNWLDQGTSPDAYSYLYCSNFYTGSLPCNYGTDHYWLGTNLETLPPTTNLYGNYNLNQ